MSTVSTADRAPAWAQIGIGLDTQSWSNDERQFFQAIFRPIVASSGDRFYLRTTRAPGGGIQIYDTGISYGALLVGQNEDKVNVGYMRLTVEIGPTPKYLELQAGGRVVNLSTMPIGTISEPLQLDNSTPDWSANFRGGMNPIIDIQTAAADMNTVAAGIVISDVCVTFGDVIA